VWTEPVSHGLKVAAVLFALALQSRAMAIDGKFYTLLSVLCCTADKHCLFAMSGCQQRNQLVDVHQYLGCS
jgi:hypothetical protein